MEANFENKERVPVVETVRAAIFQNGRFLILEKTADSKNPGALEFPGGKIDQIKKDKSTEEEQKQTVIKEVLEETGIDVSKIPIEKVDFFEIYFEVLDKDGQKKKCKRLVHLFLIRLPEDKIFIPKVNTTLNVTGKSEDNHAGYKWLSPDELVASVTITKDHPKTEERFYPLARNSRHLKKLFEKLK